MRWPGLAAQGMIPDEDAACWPKPIALLRTIEHRLQMIDDRQTHRLPDDPAELDNVAHLAVLRMGCADRSACPACCRDAAAGSTTALEADEATPLPQSRSA
jgi:glutamate-ammonia-ligase adenylyltransferase